MGWFHWYCVISGKDIDRKVNKVKVSYVINFIEKVTNL